MEATVNLVLTLVEVIVNSTYKCPYGTKHVIMFVGLRRQCKDLTYGQLNTLLL